MWSPPFVEKIPAGADQPTVAHRALLVPKLIRIAWKKSGGLGARSLRMRFVFGWNLGGVDQLFTHIKVDLHQEGLDQEGLLCKYYHNLLAGVFTLMTRVFFTMQVASKLHSPRKYSIIVAMNSFSAHRLINLQKQTSPNP